MSASAFTIASAVSFSVCWMVLKHLVAATVSWAELLEQRICPSVPLSNVHAVIGRVEQQDLPSVQREVEVRFAAGLRRACCAPAPDSP
jgi:hypothetical protein